MLSMTVSWILFDYCLWNSLEEGGLWLTDCYMQFSGFLANHVLVGTLRNRRSRWTAFYKTNPHWPVMKLCRNKYNSLIHGISLLWLPRTGDLRQYAFIPLTVLEYGSPKRSLQQIPFYWGPQMAACLVSLHRVSLGVVCMHGRGQKKKLRLWLLSL